MTLRMESRSGKRMPHRAALRRSTSHEPQVRLMLPVQDTL